MIRKFLEAHESGAKEVVLWGDGSPTREFLYVEDAAEGILAAAERYDGADPVNLGSGDEISIKDLATLVARETGFGGGIRWDASRPNGQPRRKLDVTRAETALRMAFAGPADRGPAPHDRLVQGSRRDRLTAGFRPRLNVGSLLFEATQFGCKCLIREPVARPESAHLSMVKPFLYRCLRSQMTSILMF